MQAHVEIVEVKPGLRGSLATRSFVPGDVVVRLPRSLAIELASSSTPAPARLPLPCKHSSTFAVLISL